MDERYDEALRTISNALAKMVATGASDEQIQADVDALTHTLHPARPNPTKGEE